MIYRIIIFIAAVHCCSAAVIDPRAGCEIDPLLYANSPLVIPTGGTTFLYPDYGETTLKFAVGQVVDLVCPGGNLVVLGVRSTEVVQATCISNARFRILGERTLFSQVSCAQDAVAASRFTGRTCESSGRQAEIGFSLGDGRFLRTIEVCYDATAQTALYTYYDLTSSIGNGARGTPRPQFTQDNGFYSVGTQTVNQLYVRAVQRRNINSLLGLAATSTKYVQDGSWFFLARGHLTARSDFFYPAQMNATFRYINAAPQWQTFNGLNWAQAEVSTRNYASRNGVNLRVWTGLYGVTTLPHETTARDVQLALHTATNGSTGLRVPSVFWKVVYNPTTRRGVALIGVNNPYETNVSKYVICTDVSSSLNWLTWSRTNITRGFSYACTIPDLRRVVTYVPNLTVTGLLV